ncbi:MAG: hypothetical protein ACRC30_05065 [Clostridium sp.]
MNREELNSLSVLEQVKYFNHELMKNNFNAICKEIGVSKNTIKKRFIESGFTEKREGQIIKEFINDNLDSKEKEILKIEKNIKEVDVDIIKRVELLETQMKELKSNKNIISVIKEDSNKDITKVIQYFEDETIVKTFKIDKEVNKELEKLQSKFKQYKKQDIVSSLLKYAIENLK